MYQIIWCIFTLAVLELGSANYHFYVTSHPNMIEYLNRMAPEKTRAAKYPSLIAFCRMLKESRIFKAVDPAAPNFQILYTDWELLLNFTTNPSVVMQEKLSLHKLSMDIKKEIDKLGKDRQYNAQLLCLKSPEYQYYLVFNWSYLIPNFDKLLLVRHVNSFKSAILGLVQMHTDGTSRLHMWNNPLNAINLEVAFMWGFNGKPPPPNYQLIKKETFCSMEKYHLLNYCSRTINMHWDLLEFFHKGFPGMADPSIMNSVEVGNYNCIKGEVTLPTKERVNVPTVFLPCIINHGKGLRTYFHLTPSAGLFVAKNTFGKNYMLYGAIYDMKVIVNNVDEKQI